MKATGSGRRQMVSRVSYRQRTLGYWRQWLVKTNRVMRNGMIEIPAGTVCSVIDKRGGFGLKTEACKTCGVSVFIRKIEPEAVELFKRAET